jgi:hypothetical protein
VKRHNLINTRRCRRGCFVVTALLLATTATKATAADTGPSGWKNPLVQSYTTGPLDICDQGTFYVGGAAKITPYATTTSSDPQEVIIGDMYVHFQIPKKHRQWPLIMVEGGGYTGSAVESTPHGTEGWDSYSVRNDLSTFVVDQAGRGRSGWDSSVFEEVRRTNDVSKIPTLRLTAANGAWVAYRFGALIPSGSTILNGTLIQHGDPGDPICATNPVYCTYHPTIDFNAVDPQIQAGVGAIGPAPNPANKKPLALLAYKYQVPYGDYLLPTSTCSTCSPSTVAGDDTWSGRDLAELVAGLGGAIVAVHSQSGHVSLHMTRFLKEQGQLDKLKGIINIEGSCDIAAAGLAADGSDFDNIPYLALKGDYNTPAVPCQNLINTLNARRAAGHGTAKADYILLDAASYNGKFNGTPHMMMQGKNNLDVFDEILKWTNANISNPVAANSCPPGQRSK